MEVWGARSPFPVGEWSWGVQASLLGAGLLAGSQGGSQVLQYPGLRAHMLMEVVPIESGACYLLFLGPACWRRWVGGRGVILVLAPVLTLPLGGILAALGSSVAWGVVGGYLGPCLATGKA